MKVLTFRYDCGYEISVPVQPGMRKTSLAAWASPMVSKRHKRECVPCRDRRRQTALRRWYGDEPPAEGVQVPDVLSEDLEEITFTTNRHATSTHAPPRPTIPSDPVPDTSD